MTYSNSRKHADISDEYGKFQRSFLPDFAASKAGNLQKSQDLGVFDKALGIIRGFVKSKNAQKYTYSPEGYLPKKYNDRKAKLYQLAALKDKAAIGLVRVDSKHLARTHGLRKDIKPNRRTSSKIKTKLCNVYGVINIDSVTNPRRTKEHRTSLRRQPNLKLKNNDSMQLESILKRKSKPKPKTTARTKTRPKCKTKVKNVKYLDLSASESLKLSIPHIRQYKNIISPITTQEPKLTLKKSHQNYQNSPIFYGSIYKPGSDNQAVFSGLQKTHATERNPNYKASSAIQPRSTSRNFEIETETRISPLFESSIDRIFDGMSILDIFKSNQNAHFEFRDTYKLDKPAAYLADGFKHISKTPETQKINFLSSAKTASQPIVVSLLKPRPNHAQKCPGQTKLDTRQINISRNNSNVATPKVNIKPKIITPKGAIPIRTSPTIIVNTLAHIKPTIPRIDAPKTVELRSNCLVLIDKTKYLPRSKKNERGKSNERDKSYGRDKSYDSGNGNKYARSQNTIPDLSPSTRKAQSATKSIRLDTLVAKRLQSVIKPSPEKKTTCNSSNSSNNQCSMPAHLSVNIQKNTVEEYFSSINNSPQSCKTVFSDAEIEEKNDFIYITELKHSHSTNINTNTSNDAGNDAGADLYYNNSYHFTGDSKNFGGGKELSMGQTSSCEPHSINKQNDRNIKYLSSSFSDYEYKEKVAAPNSNQKITHNGISDISEKVSPQFTPSFLPSHLQQEATQKIHAESHCIAGKPLNTAGFEEVGKPERDKLEISINDLDNNISDNDSFEFESCIEFYSAFEDVNRELQYQGGSASHTSSIRQNKNKIDEIKPEMHVEINQKIFFGSLDSLDLADEPKIISNFEPGFNIDSSSGSELDQNEKSKDFLFDSKCSFSRSSVSVVDVAGSGCGLPFCSQSLREGYTKHSEIQSSFGNMTGSHNFALGEPIKNLESKSFVEVEKDMNPLVATVEAGSFPSLVGNDPQGTKFGENNGNKKRFKPSKKSKSTDNNESKLKDNISSIEDGKCVPNRRRAAPGSESKDKTYKIHSISAKRRPKSCFLYVNDKQEYAQMTFATEARCGKAKNETQRRASKRYSTKKEDKSCRLGIAMAAGVDADTSSGDEKSDTPVDLEDTLSLKRVQRHIDRRKSANIAGGDITSALSSGFGVQDNFCARNRGISANAAIRSNASTNARDNPVSSVFDFLEAHNGSANLTQVSRLHPDRVQRPKSAMYHNSFYGHQVKNPSYRSFYLAPDSMSSYYPVSCSPADCAGVNATSTPIPGYRCSANSSMKGSSATATASAYQTLCGYSKSYKNPVLEKKSQLLKDFEERNVSKLNAEQISEHGYGYGYGYGHGSSIQQPVRLVDLIPKDKKAQPSYATMRNTNHSRLDKTIGNSQFLELAAIPNSLTKPTADPKSTFRFDQTRPKSAVFIAGYPRSQTPFAYGMTQQQHQYQN